MAAGVFLFLGIFRQIAIDAADTRLMATVILPGMLLAGLSLMLGMLVSLFHLGNPFRAYRAVTNLRSSWLSREVLLTVVFFGLWLVFFICESNGIYIQYLSWLVMLAAILSVLSMASIYYSTGNRGWNRIHTYTGFLESVIILGSAATTVIIVHTKETSLSLVGLLKISVLLLVVFIVIKLSQQLALVINLKTADNTRSIDNLVASNDFETVSTEIHRTLTIWGIVLSISGAGTAVFALRTGSIQSAGPYLMIAAALILTGEVFGRAGFYSLCRSDESDTK